MKKFLLVVWIMFCIILFLFFIVSCFSAVISPSSFSFMPLFAIAFPYLFAAMFLCCIISFFVRKKSAIVLLICLLPGLYNLSHTIAFNFSSSFNHEKSDSTLRILTWNVQDFVDLMQNGSTSKEMIDVIAHQNADLVCFQEFTNVEGAKNVFSVRQKMDSLGFHYHFFSKDIDIKGGVGDSTTRGSAVFSKSPIVDSNLIQIRNEVLDESMIAATINFNNIPFTVYTAHLASFLLYRDTDNVNKNIYHITYSRKHVIEYQLRATEQAHQQEAAIITNTIKQNSLPVLYCGDMNSVPVSYTYHSIKNNLQDAFLEKGSGIGKTFYKLIPTLRIDYLFADKRFKVVQCTVINQKLSDHYAVVTDLQWK